MQSGEFGEQYVKERLRQLGWDVDELVRTNQPNFDIVAKKASATKRIQVKTKKHKEKASLGGGWSPERPIFNKVPTEPFADYVVIVRFTDDTDIECFVLPISEAEALAEWFGTNLLSLGKSPSHMYPYVGRRIRQSREYPFNVREPWERYSEAWDLIR
jgi:hypothetical protein